VTYDVIKLSKYNNKGRPAKNQEPDSYTYQIKVTGISSDWIAIMKKRKTRGRFVLATNVLEKNILTDEAMLMEYKDQSEVERGFRFIKNDTFGLDEIYLKKPERIGALMAVMTLCLLVYGLTQYQLREALQHHDEVLPTQTKKPTNKPTLLWIFALFSTVTMIRLNENHSSRRILLNVQPLHQKIILLLGDTARKIYLLPDGLTVKDIVLNQKNWLTWCGM
jgi:transposase